MSAVVYTRVSTDEQAKNGLSLQGQKESALKYCADIGAEVENFFSDEGESAKTANRPKLLEALEYCKKNFKSVDYFVVWKFDRLARNTEDHLIIRATLKKFGIKICSVTEHLEDDPTGRLMETILAGYAQFDNEVRGERSSAGVKRRIEEGGWPHMAPLGYTNFTDSLRRPTLKANETAPMIKSYLLEYLKGGRNLREMNQYAWELGIRSKSGKRLSYQQSINILRNPIYAGLVLSKMLSSPIQGLHEGLITLEQHEAIIEKLDGKKNGKSGAIFLADWPLRNGFLKCADCSNSLTGSAPRGRKKHYPMYSCTTCRARSVGHRVSVPREEVHKQFEMLLESITPNEIAMKLFREVVVKKWNNAHQDEKRRTSELQQKIDVLEKRRQTIIDKFLDGHLLPEEKLEQSALVDSELLRTKLLMSETAEHAVNADVLINFGINMISNLPKLWRIADTVERQRLQQAVFPEGLTYSFEHGFRTAVTGELYGVLEQLGQKDSNVVGVVGLEPTTNRL